ncbi:helix-turn-helix domain-containing protein [Streptomyces sp. NPDC058231]|uniref:helix-turn-helix domain-containing protein n=1 Tax=Streptomyces sp. NPDC058231 TaxID=3346392 RepID=UPI0036F02DBE
MTQSSTDTADPSPLPSPKERRRLREAKALSEEQVARAVGVTPATVRAWESGRTSPQGRKRETYAKLICPDGAGGTEPQDAVERAPGHSARDARTGPSGPTKRSPSPPQPSPSPAPVPPPPPSPPSGRAPAGTGSVRSVAPAPIPGGADTPSRTAAEAFDELYARNAGALFRQTFLLTGRRNLAGESVERAFEQAWHRWPEVAVDRDPAGWVRAAAYEYAVSPWHQLRRAHRQVDPPPDAPGPRALLQALLDLPSSYRRTLLLHDGVGLDLPDTAAETEASTPAAAGRLRNARAAVTDRIPGLALPPDPAGQSALLREQLGALALTQPMAALPAARAIRAGSEHRAVLWTRAAIGFMVLLLGLAAIVTLTAPARYETPSAPAERVGGVAPRSGPQRLSPHDLKVHRNLSEEVVHGRARLVPQPR